MVIQHHLKLKLNHVVNQKSANPVHGVNGRNVTLNATNLVKCSVTVHAIAPLVFLKKMKNVDVTVLNVKPVKGHHVHALAIGLNGPHVMASVVAVNAPVSAMIHVYLTLSPKLKKKCAKRNSVLQLNGPIGPNVMLHLVDGAKNSDIVIVKVIVIAKIQIVDVETWKNAKLVRANQNVNGLDGSQLNLVL
jgi:hypothetical protein